MKQTYEERVRAIQQEMLDRVRTTAELNRVDFALSFSRITVELAASAIREYAVKCAAIPCDGTTVEQYIKEQGLIPDGGQEAGKELIGQCPECGTDYAPGDTFCEFCKKFEPTIKRMGNNGQEAGSRIPINEQAAQYADRALKEVINRTGLPTSEIVKQSEIKPKQNEH